MNACVPTNVAAMMIALMTRNALVMVMIVHVCQSAIVLPHTFATIMVNVSARTNAASMMIAAAEYA
jgi:hypothetical protein